MTDTLKPECAAVLAEISSYLDGELDSAACHTIEQHCEGCPDCAGVVRGLRETIGLCRGVALVQVPDAVRARARAAIRAVISERN